MHTRIHMITCRTVSVTVGLWRVELQQSVSSVTELGLTPHHATWGTCQRGGLFLRICCCNIVDAHTPHMGWKVCTHALRVIGFMYIMHRCLMCTHTHTANRLQAGILYTHGQPEAAPACMPTVTYLNCVNSDPLK